MGGHGAVGSVECRANTGCSKRFDDAKRVASNCDRVIYTPGRGGWRVTHYFVAVPHEDDAQSGVFQSDHDPVVAVCEHRRGASMLVVTFNCEAQSTPAVGGTWRAFLSFIERRARRACKRRLADFSAVCVCLQEAGPANTMAADVQGHLAGTHVVVEGRTSPLLARDFVVHCVVALSPYTYPSEGVTETSPRVMHFGKMLTKLVVRDKGAAFLYIGTGGEPGFVIGSAHLPINKRDEPGQGGTLGFELREAALKYVHEEVVSTTDRFVVIAGDLNFRRHNADGGADELMRSGLLAEIGMEEHSALATNTCKLASVPLDSMPAAALASAADLEPYEEGVLAISDSPKEEDKYVWTLQRGGSAREHAAAWALLGLVTLASAMLPR